jgi:hypothetical protein
MRKGKNYTPAPARFIHQTSPARFIRENGTGPFPHPLKADFEKEDLGLRNLDGIFSSKLGIMAASHMLCHGIRGGNTPLTRERDFSPKLAAGRKIQRRLDDNGLGRIIRNTIDRQVCNRAGILYAISNEAKVADYNAGIRDHPISKDIRHKTFFRVYRPIGAEIEIVSRPPNIIYRVIPRSRTLKSRIAYHVPLTGNAGGFSVI